MCIAAVETMLTCVQGREAILVSRRCRITGQAVHRGAAVYEHSGDAEQDYFCDGLVEDIGAAKRHTPALDAGSQCVRIGPTVFGRAGACCFG